MNTAVKTTLNFVPIFYARLKSAAQQMNKQMVEVIQEHLDPVLNDIQKEQHRKIFDRLKYLKGMVKSPITDVSTTIDDYLYGDKSEFAMRTVGYSNTSILLDTDMFVGYFVTGDAPHQTAATFFATLDSQFRTPVMTEYVLIETATIPARHFEDAHTTKFLSFIEESALTVLEIDSDQRQAAQAIFRKHVSRHARFSRSRFVHHA